MGIWATRASLLSDSCTIYQVWWLDTFSYARRHSNWDWPNEKDLAWHGILYALRRQQGKPFTGRMVHPKILSSPSRRFGLVVWHSPNRLPPSSQQKNDRALKGVLKSQVSSWRHWSYGVWSLTPYEWNPLKRWRQVWLKGVENGSNAVHYGL